MPLICRYRRKYRENLCHNYIVPSMLGTYLPLLEVRKYVPEFPRIYIFSHSVLEEKQRVKSCYFSTRYDVFLSCSKKNRAGRKQNNSVVHILPCAKYLLIYKSEEIYENFSENTCSNVMNNAI